MSEKKLRDRIKEDRVSSVAHMIGTTPTGPQYRWDVTLMCQGRVFRLPDPFESVDQPTTFDVLDLLTGSCNIVDQCADRDEWAREYDPTGDPEQRHFTDRMWETWQEINNGLVKLLGHQGHEDYLYNTDRSDG